jgi:hypothetical protein
MADATTAKQQSQQGSNFVMPIAETTTQPENAQSALERSSTNDPCIHHRLNGGW